MTITSLATDTKRTGERMLNKGTTYAIKLMLIWFDGSGSIRFTVISMF